MSKQQLAAILEMSAQNPYADFSGLPPTLVHVGLHAFNDRDRIVAQPFASPLASIEEYAAFIKAHQT
jgi:hypothetical protein